MFEVSITSYFFKKYSACFLEVCQMEIGYRQDTIVRWRSGPHMLPVPLAVWKAEAIQGHDAQHATM